MKNETGILSAILELGKIRISASVSVTSAVGYLLYKPVFDFDLLIVITGVLILSMGSASLNHYQEVKYDSMMKRTIKRPLVAGFFSRQQGLAISGILSSLGLLILILLGNITTVIIGLLTLILYNLIYTPLKRLSTLSIIPGAFVGALPPAIGWVAAGGDYMHPAIWAIGVFIFVWQIPHFWLLLLLYDADYRNAGYPVLTDILNKEQLGRITFIWIVSLTVLTLTIPVYGLINSLWMLIVFILASSYLIFSSRFLLREDLTRNLIIKAFKLINFYVLIVLILITVNKLL